MAVIRAARIQTVEAIYDLVLTAVLSRRPISAFYNGRRRLFCPHRLGRNKAGQLRVLCYQYGGGSDSGLQADDPGANWRCIVLEKLSQVELTDDAWRTAPNHSRPQTCVAEADADAEEQGAENPARPARPAGATGSVAQ